MKEPKWLYRFEATRPGHGLWYDENGHYCWDMGTLENSTTKDLPMGYDERYQKDGRNWYSSCSNQEDIKHWFSYDDAKKLQEIGFVAAKYLTTEYEEYDFETTFIKDTALERIELNLEEFFGRKES